jgi:hypothetical protein
MRPAKGRAGPEVRREWYKAAKRTPRLPNADPEKTAPCASPYLPGEIETVYGTREAAIPAIGGKALI